MIQTRPGSFHLVVDEPGLAVVYEGVVEPRLRCLVVGPFDYWSLLAMRRAHALFGDRPLGSDLFLWSCGAPPHPAMTRLGGVPYLPAARAWPRRDGHVATFYGQLNFTDSKDLVPFVPADVLLVFKYFTSDATSWDRALYEFVWVDVDESVAHLAADGVPADAHDDEPSFFGVRVRTDDDATLVERVRGSRAPAAHVIPGTKIGGCARDVQSIVPPSVPADWRFVGQITAVFPPTRVPFPLLAHPEPVDLDANRARYDRLTQGPGDGVLCLYLDGADRVQIRFSCS